MINFTLLPSLYLSVGRGSVCPLHGSLHYVWATAPPRPRQEAGAAQEFRVGKRPGKLQGKEAEAGRAAGRSDPGPGEEPSERAGSSETLARRARGRELWPDLAAASEQDGGVVEGLAWGERQARPRGVPQTRDLGALWLEENWWPRWDHCPFPPLPPCFSPTFDTLHVNFLELPHPI